MKSLRLKLVLLVPFLISVVIILKAVNSNWIFKAKEPENSQELLELTFQKISEIPTNSDTIYVVKQRIVGVCGNDESLKSNFVKDLFVNNRIRYQINLNTIKNEYKIKGKTILVGEGFDNEFSSESIRFNNDTLQQKRQIFDLDFTMIKKDEVTGKIIDFANNKSILNLQFKDEQNHWKTLSHQVCKLKS